MLDAPQLDAWLLRLGLAFVYLYAALSALVDSSKFTPYMPPWLPSSIHRYCVPMFSAYELLLVIGLLTGRHLFAVSMLCALTVAGIVVVNPDAFEVLFRNVAIACAALALAVNTRTSERRSAGRLQPGTERTPSALVGLIETVETSSRRRGTPGRNQELT